MGPSALEFDNHQTVGVLALPMVRLLAPIVLTSGAPLHGRTRYSESDARRT